MRAIWTSWGAAGLVGCAGLLACGESKPAKDAHDWPEPPPPSASGADEHTDTPAPTSHASVDTPPPSSGSTVTYDKEAVEVVLKRAARQVKANCGAATDEDGKATGPWGIKVSIVEVKDVEIPQGMQRAMARQGRAYLTRIFMSSSEFPSFSYSMATSRLKSIFFSSAMTAGMCATPVPNMTLCSAPAPATSFKWTNSRRGARRRTAPTGS